jgi:hypothetical protein
MTPSKQLDLEKVNADNGGKVEPHGLKPVTLHMLQKAEPSEAYPTTLLRASKGTLSAFIHGLRDCGFLRRRVTPISRQECPSTSMADNP